MRSTYFSAKAAFAAFTNNAAQRSCSSSSSSRDAPWIKGNKSRDEAAGFTGSINRFSRSLRNFLDCFSFFFHSDRYMGSEKT
jgi:hypothetical protein